MAAGGRSTSAKISKLGLPVIIPVAEFRDLVGAAITATLSGADPATELKKAHEQFRPILERSEKASSTHASATALRGRIRSQTRSCAAMREEVPAAR